MSKAEFNALEKLFAAEVDGALNDKLGMVQSKAKVYRDLAEQGLCEEKTVTLGGRFPVRITGYVLTLEGNFVYCTSENLARAGGG